MKTPLIIAAAIAICTTPLFAQELQAPKGSDLWDQLYDPPYTEPTEIPANEPLRKELFNILRPRIEKLAGKPVLFQGSLKAYRNWAMFMGEGLDKESEKPLTYDEFESTSVIGLWLRTLEGWKLIDFDAGATDAFYVIWPEQFGTPEELIKS